MSRPSLEVADLVRLHGEDFLKRFRSVVSSATLRVLRDIRDCRTAALGGHVQRCDQCGHEEVSYNSCRNRHCPKCQAAARAEWLAAREDDLLPVCYFHVVFTVPSEIAAIALQNKRLMYGILLRASAQTLLQIASDPKHLGARTGFISVLHTWGQNLMHHPHVHCVVPGGGLSPDGDHWIPCRPEFFLPVRVLGRVFRGKFLAMTKRAFADKKLIFQGALSPLLEPSAFAAHMKRCYKSDWVVYAKKPFGGPQQVLKYLARYTHRVAISNHRLLALDDGRVRFLWKNYARGSKIQVMTLDVVEFLRRFLLHVLPRGFMRIRHYGILANTNKATMLAQCREALNAKIHAPEATSTADLSVVLDPDDLRSCPQCGNGRMLIAATLQPGEQPPAAVGVLAPVDSS